MSVLIWLLIWFGAPGFSGTVIGEGVAGIHGTQ